MQNDVDIDPEFSKQ